MKRSSLAGLLCLISVTARLFAVDAPGATNAPPPVSPTNAPPIEMLPLIKIVASDPTALEGATTGAFTLIRRGDTNPAVTVHFEISGTASNGVDYVAITNAVTLGAGVLSSNILVQPIDNGQFDRDKNVILTLTTNANYRLSSHRKAEVVIVDNAFNNLPPMVSMVTPTNGTVVAAGSNVTLTANATDPDDPIAHVSFFANDHFLGAVTNAPYSLVWSNVPPGKFSLEARATDRGGESDESASVTLMVTNALPVVQLTSPTNNAVFVAPAKIPLAAEASASAGAVVRVSFFANDRLIGVSTKSPFGITWNNVRAGNYTLVARATDQFGTSAKSDPVKITVNPGAQTPPGSNTPPGSGKGNGGSDDNDNGNDGHQGQGVKPLPGGQVQLTFTVPVDGQYDVQFSHNLKDWVSLGVVTSQNKQVVFTEDSMREHQHGFYRLVPVKSGTP